MPRPTPRTRARSCRRAACSTASAPSARRRSTARPVPAGFTGRATADHPPGFYGPPEGLLAVNTLAPADRLSPLDFAPLNARREVYRLGEPQDLRGPIFLAALALLLLDALVVFWLAGGLRRLAPRRRAPASRRASSRSSPSLAALAFMRSRTPPAQDPDVPKSALRNPARLCHHRRRRGRHHQQGRAAGPDAVPRAAHRARSRRADRARPRARRARVLPADLLADRARRRQAVAKRRSRASTPT